MSDVTSQCNRINMLHVKSYQKISLHSDIIPGDLTSNIWRNNAYKISYIRKERRANITERRRNSDWMALNGHWNVPAIQSTECWLKGDWLALFSFNGMVAFRLVMGESPWDNLWQICGWRRVSLVSFTHSFYLVLK